MNLKLEQTLLAWIYRSLLGPAQIIDGILMTISLGSFSLGLSLKCARKLSVCRFNSLSL